MFKSQISRLAYFRHSHILNSDQQLLGHINNAIALSLVYLTLLPITTLQLGLQPGFLSTPMLCMLISAINGETYSFNFDSE